MKLPSFLKPFFWDVDVGSLEVDAHREFVIERILECGDEAAVCYLFKTFEIEKIKDVVRKSRRLSRRSRNFWRLFFGIEESECTSKQYPSPCMSCW